MATDGVKIIDGDTAHDVYWKIMDQYDDGVDMETIRHNNPFPPTDFYDAFDYEIEVTAHALAMWEIGHLTPEVLNEVRRVMDAGACVKVWTDEVGEKAGRQRQRELDKLWSKISVDNPKPRKRKQYKKVTNFLFRENDVLAFRLPDGDHSAAVLLNIRQYRGACMYEFGLVYYKATELPSMADIAEASMVGRQVPSGHNMDMDSLLNMSMEDMIQPGGIEALMKREAQRTDSFYSTMSIIGVDHKDLQQFADQFTKVGEVNIQPGFRNTGTFHGAAGFEDFTRDFLDLNRHIEIIDGTVFAIKDLTAG